MISTNNFSHRIVRNNCLGGYDKLPQGNSIDCNDKSISQTNNKVNISEKSCISESSSKFTSKRQPFRTQFSFQGKWSPSITITSDSESLLSTDSEDVLLRFSPKSTCNLPHSHSLSVSNFSNYETQKPNRNMVSIDKVSFDSKSFYQKVLNKKCHGVDVKLYQHFGQNIHNKQNQNSKNYICSIVDINEEPILSKKIGKKNFYRAKSISNFNTLNKNQSSFSDIKIQNIPEVKKSPILRTKDYDSNEKYTYKETYNDTYNRKDLCKNNKIEPTNIYNKEEKFTFSPPMTINFPISDEVDLNMNVFSEGDLRNTFYKSINDTKMPSKYKPNRQPLLSTLRNIVQRRNIKMDFDVDMVRYWIRFKRFLFLFLI